MEHTHLGRTGLTVSRLCLGTMTFGYQCDEDTSFAILDRAFEAGITFIDTADVYPLGGSGSTLGATEDILGRWLRGRRDDVVLATKCHYPTSRRPWDQGNSRMHITSAIEASLRRLRTDHVDLYQLHAPDPDTPIDETLQALDDLVHARARCATSGAPTSWPTSWPASLGRSEVLGTARFDSVQPRYNLLFREIERELLPLCAEEGIGVIPYNPIAGGLLTGKHQREPDRPRRAPGSPSATPPTATRTGTGTTQEFDTVDALRPLADEAGMSLTQLAVAWVLANPTITSPIIGASRPEQLDDSLRAVDTPLDADLKARLDELTAAYRKGDAGR